MTPPEGPAAKGEEARGTRPQPAPCSRCGGVEMRRSRTTRPAALWNWFLDGPSGRGDREEWARCGQVRVSLTFGWRDRPLAGTPVGAPWRVIQALRENRSEEPVPAFYVGVVVAGTVVGIGLDLLVGLPWWLAPVLAVCGAWLYFLSSAFRGLRGHLGLDLKIALRPRRASELHDEHTERVFRSSPLPLSAWTSRGRAIAGSAGTDRRTVA